MTTFRQEPWHAVWAGLGVEGVPDFVDELHPLRERFRSSTSVEAQYKPPPSTPLMSGVLDLDTLTVLYGPPKSGKSFVALSWALSVATGAWWLSEHECARQPVLYVAAKGARGLKPRIEAWRSHHNITAFSELSIVDGSVHLMSLADAGAFAEYAAELEPRLIVIDTLARCMVGADESQAKDMGVVIEHLEQIRRATSAAVVVVHHTGRSGANMRGSSALDGAADMAYSVTRKGDAVSLDLRMAKDHPDGIGWRLSLVSALDSKAINKYRPQDGTTQTSDMLALLRSLDLIDPTGAGETRTTWTAARPKAIAEDAMTTVVGALETAKYVERMKAGNGHRFKVTPAGKHALLVDDRQDEQF